MEVWIALANYEKKSREIVKEIKNWIWFNYMS